MISKGASQLLDLLKEIFPNQRIVMEHNIAERGALFLDFYLPDFSLAFEFDGGQHTKFVEHFHKDRSGFLKAKKRDFAKEDRCRELDIGLVRVTANQLTKEFLLGKIEELLDG